MALPLAGMTFVWYAAIPYAIILLGSYYLLSKFRDLPEPTPLHEGHISQLGLPRNETTD